MKSTRLMLAESLTEHCREWSNEQARAFETIRARPHARRAFVIDAQRRARVAYEQAWHYRQRAIEAWGRVT